MPRPSQPITNCEEIVHLRLGNKPFMLENRPIEGLATGANPIAPRSGGAGAYEDYTLWPLTLFQNWDLGVGWENSEDGGFLYSEAETRYRGKIMLPPLTEYSPLENDDCDCACTFKEVCDSLWVAKGKSLYKDGELVYTSDSCIEDMEEYGGYILMAHGDDAPFSWYATEDGATGTGPYNFKQWYVYAGLLYGASCSSIRYTAGLNKCSEEYEEGTDLTPTLDNCAECYDLVAEEEPCDFAATPWCWTEEIQVGACNSCCCINGMAGMINSSFSSQLLYISTCDKLYALFPGDIVVHIADWPVASEFNGAGAVNHFGNIYLPMGNTLMRIAQNGDLIYAGIDRGEGLPCDKHGRHAQQLSTPQWLLSVIEPEDEAGSPSLWAFSNDAWHFIACYTPGTKPCGAHYSAKDTAVYVCLSDGTIAKTSYVSGNDNPVKSKDARFAPSGFVDLGVFYGGYRELEKYFHSIFIDGDCITPSTRVRMMYAVDEDSQSCNVCGTEAEWSELGTLSTTSGELYWCNTGSTVKAKRLKLRIELETDDPTITPVVRAIRVKHLPRIVRQVQFSYAIHLPKDCMLDMRGVEIFGYSQREWDCCLAGWIDGGEPIHFVDVDDREYQVIITDFSKRTWNLSCDGCEKSYDISYYLTLLQVDPDSIDCEATLNCGQAY
jgi:hypothetical protein